MIALSLTFAMLSGVSHRKTSQIEPSACGVRPTTRHAAASKRAKNGPDNVRPILLGRTEEVGRLPLLLSNIDPCPSCFALRKMQYSLVKIQSEGGSNLRADIQRPQGSKHSSSLKSLLQLVSLGRHIEDKMECLILVFRLNMKFGLPRKLFNS